MAQSLSLVGGAVGGAVAIGWAIGRGEFLSQHLGTLLTAALSAAALVGLAGAAARAVWIAARTRRLGEEGAAMAEFVIVVGPFLLFMFGLMQLALCSFARLMVSHAAFTAARAAAVTLPGVTRIGPNRYEKPGDLGDGLNAPGDYAVSQKIGRIRDAAVYALIPAAPAVDVLATSTGAGGEFYALAGREIDRSLTGALEPYRAQVSQSLDPSALAARSVGRALDGGDSGDAIVRSARKLVGARLLTAVTLRGAAGSVRSHFDWNQPITARVTFLMPCLIPIAGRIAGRAAGAFDPDSLADLSAGGLDPGALPGSYMVLSAEHTTLNQGRPGR